jgi:hypothetical protein
MNHPLEQKAAAVAQLARTLLANGYYHGDDIAPDMRGEVPLRLMYALRGAGVQRWQLEALALAVRDIGEAAPLEPAAGLDPAQKQAFDGIRAEGDLPVAFKGLLDGAAPSLVRQQDLIAFYGLLNNVIAKWDTMAALLHKDPGVQ